jgi:uncharacterized membrane protein
MMEGGDDRSSVVVKIGLLGIGAWLLWIGFQIFPAVARRPLFVPLLLVVYATGLGLWLVACLNHRRLGGWTTKLTLFCALLGVAAGFVVTVTTFSRGYGTDALAFAHTAAEHVLAGRNPYEIEGERNLDRVVERFGVPEQWLTQTVNGRPVDRLVSYPAMHFLVFVPAVAVGLTDLRWVVFAFEMVSLFIVWRMSPRWIQPLILLALLINPDLVIYFTAGSVTDWLWVLPLILSAVYLYGGRKIPAGIAFGLACAVKQQPWVAAPFIAIWLIEIAPAGELQNAFRRLLSFFGAALAAFLAPNIPFILQNPKAWISGVLSPVLDNLIYFGQGISLLTSTGFLPVSKEFYMSLALGIAAIVAALYWAYFRFLQNALWVLPAMVLWFSYRALHSHLIFWIVPAVLWFALQLRAFEDSSVSARRGLWVPLADRAASKFSRIAASLAIVLAVSLIAWAGGTAISQSAQRIGMNVVAVGDRFRLGAVDTLTVDVTNHTLRTINPVFNVMWSGYPFVWRIESGPETIGPGLQVRYVLSAPTAEALLPLDSQSGHIRDAALKVLPFYLQINEKGSYRYFVTHVPGRSVPRPTQLNPEFRYWRLSDPVTLTSVPTGWNLIRKPDSGRRPHASQSDFMGKRALQLATAAHEARANDWAEIGLVQEIIAPECLRLSLNFSRSYRTIDGWPVLIQGLELAREGELVWYAFSDTVDRTERYQLPNGHLIVVMPAKRFSWQDISIDVSADLRPKQWVGQKVTVKIFHAMHSSQVNGENQPEPMYVSRLEALSTACATANRNGQTKGN